MNWDDLRIFLEVSRAGRLESAAARLNLDQATVSRRLKRLEDALGNRLFERSRSGHKLTETGHALLQQAELIETTTHNIEAGLTDQDRLPQGIVRVNVAEGFGAFFVAPRLRKFHGLFPQLEVELVASTGFLNVSQRETDIGVHLAQPQAKSLIVRKLSDYRLKLYASRAYLDRCGAPSNLDDLQRHTVIGYVEDLIYAPELRYLEQTMKNIKAAVRASSIIAQYKAIDSGTGIGILPCFMADQNPDLTVCLPGEVIVDRTFWLVYHESSKNVARIRAMTNFLVDETRLGRAVLIGEG